MTTQRKLLQLLADGKVHSGEEIAQALGLSRAAIWKQVQNLDDLGIDIVARAGKGYQLVQPLGLLSADKIKTALSAATRSACCVLDVHWATDSTNADLLRRGPPGPALLQVATAEFQSAGKGRRGRAWLAPFGDGICLSVGWRFDASPPSFACLGLAIGVGLQRALHRMGLDDVQLKWPNDVLRADKKLAGVLIEVSGEADGPLHVVVGVGINYRVQPATVRAVIDSGGVEPAAMLQTGGPAMPDRNQVIACVVDALHEVLTVFAVHGFESFRADWQAADYLAGRDIIVNRGRDSLVGKAAGITQDGELQVATSTGVQHVLSGDVQVRAVA